METAVDEINTFIMAEADPNTFSYLDFSRRFSHDHWASPTNPRQLNDNGLLRANLNIAKVT